MQGSSRPVFTPRKKVPLQQTRKACGQPDKFDFNVPDEIWHAVVPTALQTRVVCLYCFDEFAREKNIDYAKSLNILYFAGRRASFEFRVASGVSVLD